MSTNNKYATGVKGDEKRGVIYLSVDGTDTAPTPTLTTDWAARQMVRAGRIHSDGWSSSQSADQTEIKDYNNVTIYVEETNTTDEITVTFMGLDPDAIAAWLGADNLEAIDGGWMLKFGTGNPAPQVSIAILNVVRSGKFDFYARVCQPQPSIERNFAADGSSLGVSVTFTCIYNEIDEATHIELLSDPSGS